MEKKRQTCLLRHSRLDSQVGQVNIGLSSIYDRIRVHDGCFRLLLGLHGHEAVAATLTSSSVCDHHRFFDLAEFLKKELERFVLFSSLKL